MYVFALLLSLECAGWSGFQAPVQYPSAAGDVVLVHDLDGDGAPEIIASGTQVDELAAFSLFANHGDGTFAAERLIPTAFGERIEDAGDLNGDGYADLIASNYWANGISTYLGKSGLQFDNGTPHGTATHGGPSLIFDFDRDGTPDVISLSFGSGNPVRVHLFHGNGDGTLAPKTTADTNLANAAGPSLRIIDGALEILAAERFGDLALIRYSNGVVSVSRIPTGPGKDRSCTFADVNGDGVADIIDIDDTETDPQESVFVTLANADGTFRDRKQIAQPRMVAFPIAVHVADFDGDGHADLLVSDFRSTNLFFFRGDGRGEFEKGVAIGAGGPVNDFAIADVNRDGYPDIVTANADHSVSVLVNGGPCRPSRRRAVKR